MRLPLRALLLLPLSWPACLIAEPVSFKKDIAPLLHRRCATCHSEENSKGKYRLDTFAHLRRAGDSELPPVTAGKAEDSELYRLLIEPDSEDRMPQKAEPLPSEEIDVIKRWLDEGAQYDGGSMDRSMVELARATLLRKAPDEYPRPVAVTALAFSPNGSHLATSGYYELLIWNLEDGSLERRIGGLPQQITSLSWSPQGNRVAVAGGTPGRWGTVALVNLNENHHVRMLADFSETPLSVSFHPNGTSLVVGGGDRTTRFFDVASGKETRLLRQHSDWVQSVTYSRDGNHVLSASRDRTAKVLSVVKGEVEATYTNHESPLLAAAFLDSDGSRAITVDRTRTLHEWDARSGRKGRTLTGFDGEPVQLATFDGKVVAGGGSSLLSLHQLSDGQRIFTLAGHRDTVLSMALAPGGYVLATGSADGEVLLWDLRCGTWTHRFVASPAKIPHSEPLHLSSR